MDDGLGILYSKPTFNPRTFIYHTSVMYNVQRGVSFHVRTTLYAAQSDFSIFYLHALLHLFTFKALMRPVSGGLIWGWVERAGNWACPLALMVMGKEGGAWRMPALAPLEKYLSPNSILADDLLKLAFGFLVFTWSLVFVLRNRPALGGADADADPDALPLIMTRMLCL